MATPRDIVCSSASCGKYHGKIDLDPLDHIVAHNVYDVPPDLRQPAPTDEIVCQLCGAPLFIGNLVQGRYPIPDKEQTP